MKLLLTCMMIFLSPLLISAKPEVNDPGYTARYNAPEGTLFLSYSKKWDEKKLKELHAELLRNTHGDEIYDLTEVRVFPGECEGALGYYKRNEKNITLCEGDTNATIGEMTRTLSHEYGHHVGYSYMPDYASVDFEYTKLRTTKDDPVEESENGKLNVDPVHHKWYPEEIFAEDYVQLYGARHKERDVVIHENDQIKPIQQLPKAQSYIAKMTGFPLAAKTVPHVFSIKDVAVDHHYLSYTLTHDERLRSTLTFLLSTIQEGKKEEYDPNPDTVFYDNTDNAAPVVTSVEESSDLDELFEPVGLKAEYGNAIPEDFVGEIHVHMQVINPKTNTGFSIPVAVVLRDSHGDYKLQSKK